MTKVNLQNGKGNNYARFSITLPTSKAQFIRKYAAEKGISLSAAFDQLVHCDITDLAMPIVEGSSSVESTRDMSANLHTLEHQQSPHSLMHNMQEAGFQASPKHSMKGKTVRHSVNLSRPVANQIQIISDDKCVSASEVVRQSVYRDLKIRELVIQGWKIIVQNPQNGELMDITATYILQP